MCHYVKLLEHLQASILCLPEMSQKMYPLHFLRLSRLELEHPERKSSFQQIEILEPDGFATVLNFTALPA